VSGPNDFKLTINDLNVGTCYAKYADDTIFYVSNNLSVVTLQKCIHSTSVVVHRKRDGR